MLLHGDAPAWDREGRDWPNRASSHFVAAGGLNWHVQVMGKGPVLLLIHGTGAATHSWRDLAPLLSEHFTVVAPDLPGHGFSEPLASRDLSLPGMAHALGELLRALEMKPEMVVGHSAGAAIAARLCLDGAIAPRLLVSLNGALLPFEGMAGHLFPPLARLLFLNPVAPRLFSWFADGNSVRRLLEDTGSRIDPRGVALYESLFRRVGHVAGTLGMMANWDLATLSRALPELRVPLVLVVGSNDRTVDPDVSFRLRSLVPGARVELMRGLGHLAHEEMPDQMATLLRRLAGEAGVLDGAGQGDPGLPIRRAAAAC